MIERFQGPEGGRRLIDALCRQKLVGGDEALAAALGAKGTLAEYGANEVVICEDSTDNALFLILSGTADVLVNDRVVATRDAGSFVGEMALIDPAAARCATVVATRQAVACVVAEPQFAEVAQTYSELWRRLAIELADRLRQRNSLVTPPNPRPHLFVGSSAESLRIARAVQLGLSHDNATVTVWTDGVFGASTYPMDALEEHILSADFGVLVIAPDDRVLVRGTTVHAPRDNVVFELGMCMGALTRERTFVVCPRNADIQIPTDLLGLTLLEYSLEGDGDGDLDTAIAPVCEQLRRKIESLKVK